MEKKSKELDCLRQAVTLGASEKRTNKNVF